MVSGIKVNKEVEEKYVALQKDHKHKWIVFEISQDEKTVVLKAVGDKDSSFEELLKNITVDKAYYIAYDCRYNLKDGQLREKVLLVLFTDDDNCNGKQKMIGSSTFKAVKKSCTKYQKAVGLHSIDELTEKNFINLVSENRTK